MKKQNIQELLVKYWQEADKFSVANSMPLVTYQNMGIQTGFLMTLHELTELFFNSEIFLHLSVPTMDQDKSLLLLK